MSSDPSAELSEAIRLSKTDPDAAWALLHGMTERARGGDVQAARVLAKATRERSLDVERRLALTGELVAHCGADLQVLFQLGFATETLVDRTLVNHPPPRDPIFHSVVRALAIALDGPGTDDTHHALAASLAVASMVAGRRYDTLADHAHRLLLKLQNPLGWQTLYDLGLFLKTRGRYAEATEILLYAVEIGGNSRALHWNLGICATGCLRGDLALETWRDRVGIGGLRLGQYGLPEFQEPPIQVRIAERPLATRTEDLDTPGREEIVWVERLSPAHGIVRSALVQPLGTDFGDVVLFDGSPILKRRIDEREVGVHAHLSTLIPGEAKRFEFRATQSTAGQVRRLSTALPGKAMVYVPGDFDRGPEGGAASARVDGAICIPREIEVRDVVDLLDAVLDESADPALKVWAPELHRANGDEARADRELSAWPPPSRSD